MASQVTIFYGAKQHSIKTNPQTLIISLIEEVCQKENLEPYYDYVIKHPKLNVIDSSQTIQTSRIPQGSKLDLVQMKLSTKSKINIVLNSNEFSRLTVACSVDYTIWDCLLEMERMHSINITKQEVKENSPFYKKSKVLYNQPVCQFLNKKFSTFEELSSCRFFSLGIRSGNFSLRLSYEPATFALADIIEKLNNHQSVNNQEVNKPSTSNEELKPKQIVNEPKVNQTAASSFTDIPIPSAEPTPDETINRNACIIEPSTETKIIDLPDSFYELDENEALIYFKSVSNKRLQQENAPLKTKAIQEREKNEKRQKFIEKHPKTLIRVRFPDDKQLQGTFLSQETISSVYKFVDEFIQDKSADYHLFINPPMKIFERSNDTESLLDLGLTPATVLFVGFNDKSKVPLIDIANTLLTAKVADVPKTMETTKSVSDSSISEKSERKIPKWFKFGKKT